jgi:hypothetical protein
LIVYAHRKASSDSELTASISQREKTSVFIPGFIGRDGWRHQGGLLAGSAARQ